MLEWGIKSHNDLMGYPSINHMVKIIQVRPLMIHPCHILDGMAIQRLFEMTQKDPKRCKRDYAIADL